MLEQYIIYNQQFEIVICWIYKIDVTRSTMTFSKKSSNWNFIEDRQKIDEYIKELILRSVKMYRFQHKRLKRLKELKSFKISNVLLNWMSEIVWHMWVSMEKHCRNIQIGIFQKINIYFLIYWYISKAMDFTINTNDLSIIQISSISQSEQHRRSL